MKGIIIAGAGSGVGKTSVTTGLLSRLSHDMKVQAFKTGPDYIDPMYHSVATGRKSRNLDSFMMSDDVIKNLVGYASRDADLCVVEGVRGLYEGLYGDGDLGSTAYLSKLLGFPVILVLDARSLTRSAAAIVKGFKALDPEINIAGVILNKVSGPQHMGKLETAMKTYCPDVDLVGMIPKDANAMMEERVMGLKTLSSSNTENIKPLENLVSSLDTDVIMNIAEHCECELPVESPYMEKSESFTFAVPMDDAFSFYYHDNLESLKACGGKIMEFSPVAGDSLPDADVYYMGGGYPDLHAEAISGNGDFIEGLKNMAEEGRPIVAEDGGMMPLCNGIKCRDGRRFEMAGVLDAEAVMSDIRHGPTYMIANPTSENPFFTERMKGHEYHYSEVIPGKNPKFGFKTMRGNGIENGSDGLTKGNVMGTYMHMHALSNKSWGVDISNRII